MSAATPLPLLITMGDARGIGPGDHRPPVPQRRGAGGCVVLGDVGVTPRGALTPAARRVPRSNDAEDAFAGPQLCAAGAAGAGLPADLLAAARGHRSRVPVAAAARA